jgi:hypothetical protein
MTPEEYTEKRSALYKQRAAVDCAMAELEAQWCAEHAPIKAGDVISWNDGPASRPKPMKGRVTSVKLWSGSVLIPRDPTYEYQVAVILKNGNEGSARVVRSYDDPAIVGA